MKTLLLSITVGVLLLSISCDQDEKVSDRFGINRKKVETINAIVMDTQVGWTLLSEKHGFLDLLTDFPDSLQIDGLKIKAEIYEGKTYFDAYDGSEDLIWYYRDFTYAELLSTKEHLTLYDGPEPPVIDIFWAPDYEDFEGQIPDGYGYYVQAWEGGIKIRQSEFPAVSGTGSFKTEVEAFKNGAFVIQKLITDGGLPGTKVADLDFMKIDWYVFIPDVP